MKATADKIASVHNILSGAKFSELSTKEKISVIKINNKLKPVATSINDFRKDALDKLKPEGFEEIALKVQSHTALTPAELFSYNKVEKELEECMKEAVEKEHEIEFKPL